MKRRSVILCLITCIAFAACNNDEVAPADGLIVNSLLTRISRNGLTHIELFYDIDKRLNRLNYYFGGTFSSYNLYEYSSEGIKELRRYKADNHALDYKSVFTLDNFGRVIKSENYGSPDFNKITSMSEFDYNTSGQLIRKEFRVSGQPIYLLEEYFYDDQNNLIMLQSTLYPNQKQEYINYRADYTPSRKSIPEHWGYYVFLLELSGLDEWIRDMFNAGSITKSWNVNKDLISELSFEASGEEFNSNTDLIRQLWTRKNILKPEIADDVSEMTYEYMQQYQ